MAHKITIKITQKIIKKGMYQKNIKRCYLVNLQRIFEKQDRT